MPNGDNHMDLTTLGTAAAGGAATAFGQWLWRRLVTAPRHKQMSVREMRDLIAQVDGDRNRKIEDIAKMVEDVRSERSADRRAIEEIRGEMANFKGVMDSVQRVVSRLATDAGLSGHGD